MLGTRYLTGIFLVIFAATCGWFVLGATIFVRTEPTAEAERTALGLLWGSELQQSQRGFTAVVLKPEPPRRELPPPEDVAPVGSQIAVDLGLDLRRKGLRWFPTYTVAFAGTYRVVNPKPRAVLRMTFLLPADRGTYD